MPFNIGKISLGSSARKRYSHNLSFDNNTTFDFGSVQPMLCQYMMANSDINVSCRQLVRLAPLVAPSFARLHLQNEVSFVPLADVVPYSDAMLSGLPYSVGGKTYKPSQLPYTTNAMLVYLLLHLSNFTYWDKSSQLKTFWKPSEDLVEDIDMTAVSNNLFKSVNGVSKGLFPNLSASNVIYSSDVSKVISFSSADQVVFLSDNTALTFRFSPIARRLRKIFLGLGYSLNISDRTPVSFAPILAFYKSWFDLYAVQRSQNWTNTKCFSLIKYIDDNYFYKFDATAFNTDAIYTVAFDFITSELSQCWFTYPDDFVSVHRSSVNLSSNSLSFVDGDNNTSSAFTSSVNGLVTSPSVGLSLSSTTQKATLYNVALQTLQRLSRFVNKDSIIGQRMSDWLRVHYGADVSNSVFSQSNHISSSRLDLQINDVFSTSDTANSDSGDGEVLGAYAGKGIGFDKNGFRFHTDKAGFVFMMSAIVPESGYYQGNDLSLYGLTRYTLPSADFDALGMELTPKGAIASDNNIVDYRVDTPTEDLTNKGFGFVPRFSGFKVRKNIVNGDMSLRSTYDDLSPYYLDRTLISNCILDEKPMFDTTSSKVADCVDFSFYHSNLPVASEEWRYCARYNWLGNYSRIFSNISPLISGSFVPNGTTSLFSYVPNVVTDNFICQSLFDVRVTNSLKPISESYDTFEESTDKSSIDVRPE